MSEPKSMLHSQPPIMSSLKVDEVLFAYVVVAPHTVNLVLVRVDSGPLSATGEGHFGSSTHYT